MKIKIGLIKTFPILLTSFYRFNEFIHRGLKLDGAIDENWSFQYITLVPHKSLMDHDIKKIVSYHNFYLFFPI